MKALLASFMIIAAVPFGAAAGGKRPKDVVAAPPAAPEHANGSLYSENAAGGLVTDFKPRQVGDLVFVDVVESSAASVTSSASRQRQSEGIAGGLAAAGTLPLPGAAIGAAAAAEFGKRKYAGKGSTERKSLLRARIAARVVEVMPNGDLRIEAKKTVKINKENEKLAVSGVVRPRDISAADNAIPTTAVGDLYVELNGKGVASADNAPGWLFRIFDKISPF